MEVADLLFTKGQLEKITAKCNFIKPKYVLEKTTKTNNKKSFSLGASWRTQNEAINFVH